MGRLEGREFIGRPQRPDVPTIQRHETQRVCRSRSRHFVADIAGRHSTAITLVGRRRATTFLLLHFLAESLHRSFGSGLDVRLQAEVACRRQGLRPLEASLRLLLVFGEPVAYGDEYRTSGLVISASVYSAAA